MNRSIQQRGVALVVVLLLLLAITLVATSSMQSGIIQEKITANLYDQISTSQQVEAALLEAEQRLTVADPVALIDNAGIYDLAVPGATERWLDAESVWIDATLPTAGVGEPAQYLIEYLGDWPHPPDCANVASKDRISVGCLSPTFRITARSVSSAGRSAVILQSLFRR
ncbi:pilus assembly protein [Rheinheimera sp.]|uniref:pilus assembly PilX family protein n=1 Tax=Rheinheimera sp. TaxID=1869214 RepID=UPI00307E5170